MFTYVIDNDILYLRFSNFSIIAQLGNHNKSGEEVAQAAAAVYCEYANQLLFNPNIKGVIIDVRSNGGGYLLDMFTVLGPLLKEDIHVFDTRTKMGVGRLDYGEWVPFRAQVITQRKLGELLEMEEPLPETDCIGDRQVVVLTDSWSVSMSEMTAEPVKKLPYATVIGTRTFGGHGPLTSETHFSFSGQFGDPDCASVSYYVYTSTSMSRTSEGEILEGKGITPDITVPLDVEQFTGQHIDNQLEYAIDFLHGKNETITRLRHKNKQEKDMKQNKWIVTSLLLLAGCLLPDRAAAQWKVGVNAGYAYNQYSIDTQYAYDFNFDGRGGLTVGIPVEYGILDWLAVRADFVYLQRGTQCNVPITKVTATAATTTSRCL